MKSNISLSIIVPAYNEGKNIHHAIEGIVKTLLGIIRDYEILVIDDGSTDNTLAEALKLAGKYKQVRVIRFTINRGLGYAVREGISQAKKQYITAFHGDSDANPQFFKDFILHAGNADILSIYPRHSSIRTIHRRILSKLFHLIMNAFFGLGLRYYNGTFLCKKSLLSNLCLYSKGFTIYAEIKIRLLMRGYHIQEFPFEHVKRRYGKSTAVSLKSLRESFETIIFVLWDVYILHRP